MPRGKDGSLLTKEQLKELNKRRFEEALASGNLFNTGPITESGGTSFAPDRWAAYFEENPEEAPSDWTGDSESYQEQNTGTQEYIVDDPKDMHVEVLEETVSNPDFAGMRNLQGNRKADGSLASVEITPKMRTDEDEVVAIDEVRAENKLKRAEINKSIAEKNSKLAQMEAELAEIQSVTAEDIEKQVQQEMKREEEMARKAEEAAREEQELNDLMEESAREQAAMESAADDRAFEAELSEAELEQLMMEGAADQEAMEEDWEDREYPMENMSDDEKGMFSFERTEDVADQPKNRGLQVLMDATGMNEAQAQELLNKIMGAM